MNTPGTNAPSTVIQVVLLGAAVLIGIEAHGAGAFFAHVIPGILVLGAVLMRLALLMARQWEKAVKLQDAMSRQAQAEREKAARVILGSAEAEIAQKFLEAANICARNPAALQLRAMNIVYETTKERGATILMPTSMVDAMNPVGLGTLGGLLRRDADVPPPKPAAS